MQPEDIIQAKEWAQLTAEEKRIVAPLASTEGEYNVLKKMLLIALEDAEDVPPVGPSIQQRLHAHLPKPVQANRRVMWWTAAAVILLAVATALFMRHPEQQPEAAVKTKTNPVLQTPADTAKKEPPLVTPPSPDEPILAKGDSGKQNKQKAVAVNDKVEKSPAIARINTSIGANENLLAFVTEVY